MARLLLLILVSSIIAPPILSQRAFAKDAPYKIDEATAHRLASEAECNSLQCLSALEYAGDDNKMSPPFFVYAEIGVTAIAGYYAVNPWTGNVWDLWDCKKISTKASRKTQSDIQRQFEADEQAEYKRLAMMKPACIN